MTYHQTFSRSVIVVLLVLALSVACMSNALATSTSGSVTIVQSKTKPLEVKGEGNLDKQTHFEFDVEPSKNGNQGHLNYDDKNAKIKLESTRIMFLSITPPSATFVGTAKYNQQTAIFLVHVIDNTKSNKADFFSITVINDLGHVIYSKSGNLISGHIKIQESWI